MPNTAIISGILLILIGVIGYIFSIVDGNTSLTALIPSLFGILLALLGSVAKSKENLRKHLMHVAVLVGLLGFIIPAARLISKFNDLKVSLAVLSQVAMSVVCLVFVVLCVKSFIDARKNRTI